MKRHSVTLALLTLMFAATSIAPRQPAAAGSFGGKVLTGAAIGFVVKASAKPLNKFINTITFNNHVQTHMATKVVPILSVGEKAYAGGAQVSGPASAIDKVQAVWQYEDNFSDNRFRLKVLVPSDSLNPLKIKRVQKVGVSALIDLSLDGGWGYKTVSRGFGAGDLLLAAGVGVAVSKFGPAMNKAINKISFNKGNSTKVVPMLTFGEKAYIGGGQVSGSASIINSVKAMFQYEDYFSGGKFRIKVLVPTNSTNPLKLHRVEGAGVTAVIDMSLTRQENLWDRNRDRYLFGNYRRRSEIDERYRYRHDNGLHRGWYHQDYDRWNKRKQYDKRFGEDDRDHRRDGLGGIFDERKNEDRDREREREKDKDKRERRRSGLDKILGGSREEKHDENQNKDVDKSRDDSKKDSALGRLFGRNRGEDRSKEADKDKKKDEDKDKDKGKERRKHSLFGRD